MNHRIQFPATSDTAQRDSSELLWKQFLRLIARGLVQRLLSLRAQVAAEQASTEAVSVLRALPHRGSRRASQKSQPH